MISVAVAKGTDAERQSESGNHGFFASKKLLLIMAGAGALGILALVGALFCSLGGTEENLTAQQSLGSVNHNSISFHSESHSESSRVVIVQPSSVALVAKSRWPIVAAVAALLMFVVVLTIVLSLVLAEPEIKEPEDTLKDEIPVLVEENDVSDAPIGIGSLVAAVVFVLFVLGCYWRFAGRKQPPKPPLKIVPPEDMITKDTTIDEIYPLWTCDGGIGSNCTVG